jgi:predicted anti-sigma-YlaC factor YlaD
MRFRIAALVLLFGDLLVGLWALIAPRSFYDDFPGAGRHWVSVDGAFNEHLLRDVGALNLALAVVAIAAILRPGRFARLCGISHLVWTLPHLYYHTTHLHMFSTSDAIGNVVSLSIPVIASIFLIVFRAPPDDEPGDLGPSTA